ncbi:MAG: pyrroline-5-carboxylate reductase [Ethanoligenens sp.]
MTEHIGFVGAGNMASAIVNGLVGRNVCPAAQIAVYDHHHAHYGRFEDQGVHGVETVQQLVEFADIVFLSVKPQNYDEVLQNIKPFADGKIIVSIAAGISSAFIKKRLGESAKIVLAMPNTPLLLGEGATALCQCAPLTDAEYAIVKAVFAAGGVVQDLPEEQMTAVISVSGSSPAYVYLFAKAVIEEAVKQGIDAAVAKALICQTLIGSAKMLTDSGKEPEGLIQMVSSKGGTTIAALQALYAHGFEQAIQDGMRHCTKRAEELGK